jgi:gag-polypeptide of LTR copia-type
MEKESATQIVPMVPQLISTQQLKISVKLSSSNWEQWSTFIETRLDSLRKRKYLIEEPQTTDDWKAKDSSIRMILWNAMEPDILTTVHAFKIIKKMLDHLQSTYSKRTSMVHAYAVSQVYARYEYGNATLIEYFTKFKKLSDEMRDLFPFRMDSATVWEQ